MLREVTSLLVKDQAAIDKMRTAGRLAAQTLEMINEHVKPGVTTGELDRLCHDYIRSLDARPACIGQYGYEHATCISVNHVVCHGIPGHKKLKEGDILNIDLVVEKDGYHGDTSRMFCVGKASILANRLVKVCQECLYLGIEEVKPGVNLDRIGVAIEAHARKHQYSVVRDYCGHGIGLEMHEEPQVVHYAGGGSGVILEAGMTFTIEPMINAGTYRTKVLKDEWTVVTKDKKLSAQFEHTILVTDSGSEVLTKRQDETF